MPMGPSHTTTRDPKRFSDSAERNRDPILDVLRRVLPPRGLVLEVGSGTGMHAAWFAPRLPDHVWQPSDVEEESLASIRAWAAGADAPNLRDPIPLDVLADPWPVTAADAVVSINLVHISPPETLPALLRGAAAVLPEGGVLVLYGPFMEDGAHNAPSNEAFHRSLQKRNPEWGLRDIADVRAAAEARGLRFVEKVAMPANNVSLVFRKL